MSYERQEFYRKKYSEIKSGWTAILPLYVKVLKKYLTAKDKLLDIGCGHAKFLKPIYDSVSEVWGLDPDAGALKKNKLIRNKVVGTAEKLPFDDNSFDIICSAWVMEHLENPEAVLKEIKRVLKPGGRFVFLTPNSWNYVVWIIRLIPNFLHDFLTKRLYGRQENDTMKVFYRINNIRDIRKKFEAAGFQQCDIIQNEDPSYISFNFILFKISVLLEKIIVKFFPKSKVHLIGVFKK